MAGSTGLEPATSGVTGRRSNQLNYDPAGERQKKEERRKKKEGRRKYRCRTRGVSVKPAVPLLSSVFHFPSSFLVGGTGLEPVAAGV
jgi:hypothetical protein